MPTLLKTKSIYFNDVNLIPTIGMVRSRKDIPNELYRIIVSPMISVVGETFVLNASKLGLSIASPRFMPMEQKKYLNSLFLKNKINENQKFFISIGLNEKDSEIEFLSHNSNFRDILFDIANGYVPQLEESVKRIYNEIGPLNNLMVGNYVTSKGIAYASTLLKYCNQLFCRVGIGNGRPCQSSDVAAVNRGQLNELFECGEIKELINEEIRESINKENSKKINLISDGGINKSGFVLKAFGAGSDYVLMGSYFSKSFEAETHISGDGTYFGCASEKQNKLAGLDKHSEGKIMNVNKDELKPLNFLVKELWGGISSGISYCGHKTVTDFIGNGVFEEKCNSLPPKNRV